MNKFLCVVYDACNGQELASYEIEAEDFYFARHKGAMKYQQNHPEDKRNWKVDSVEIS